MINAYPIKEVPMSSNITTLRSFRSSPMAMNQNLHDALVDVPAISSESLETMKNRG